MENRKFSREGRENYQGKNNYQAKNNYQGNNKRRDYNKPYESQQENQRNNSNNRYNGGNNRYNNNENRYNNSENRYNNNENRYNNSENRYNNGNNRYNGGNNRYNNSENRYNNSENRYNNSESRYNNSENRYSNNENRYNNNENRYNNNGNRYSNSREGGYRGNNNNGYKKPFNKKPYHQPDNQKPVEYDLPASTEEIRLNKYIADAGICSRRNADVYISSGNVTVNGEVMTTLGYRVKPTDEVRFDGKLLSSEKKEYILLNKPKGFITTTNDEKGRKTVMDLVANATNVRILPVGRLDRATTGLLLLTNDGELTKKLTHPTHGVRKIYHVILDRKLELKDLAAIRDGLTLEDGFIEVDEISYIDQKPKNEVGVKIHSGRNRIVRRIFEHLGYQVDKLDRVLFAGLTKKDLPRGHWRRLTQQEVINLKNLKIDA
ncbi:pseudouridine synthase [Capnocytophaga sp. oral taxon 332]|uniref:pseudouridine synthase n=1 Tax=Capnocytophaga sp. oral taxon 332 TaxID=712213 RepID=UPI000345CA65|nr:pseudouridine synthase [Capnocytophaga sp. oral taxon 332]